MANAASILVMPGARPDPGELYHLLPNDPGARAMISSNFAAARLLRETHRANPLEQGKPAMAGENCSTIEKKS